MNQHTGPKYSGEWIRDQIYSMGGIATFTDIYKHAIACKSTVARSIDYGLRGGHIVNIGRDYMLRCPKCGDPTTNELFCDDCETDV